MAKPVNVQVRQAQPINVAVTDKQPIQANVRASQPISVNLAQGKPVNVKVGDVVQINYITGSDLNYEQSFSDAAQLEITHNMGKRPSITVIDSAGDEVQGDYNYVDLNTVIVTFSATFSGKVVLN